MKVLSTLLVPAAMLLALTLDVTSAFAPVQGSRSDARVSTARYAAAEKAETFKKQDFVKSIQDKTGLNKADSEQALTAVLETIQEEVAAGKRINLLGFGTFKLTARAARKGRNPQTGEELQIKASNSPSFTASKVFKERVNPDR